MKKSNKKFKVYDCFNYDGEACLELRLKTHWSKIDWFVIAESNMTHSGLPKKISFDIKKYAWAKSKIRFIKVDKSNFKNCKTAWEREWIQRDSLKAGYKDASDEDVIIISDVDEIINPNKINFIEKGTYHRFELVMTYFYCDYLCVSDPLWTKALATRADFAKKNSPQDIRDGRSLFKGLSEIKIDEAGWHFSYLGGVSEIAKKLERFTHQELNSDKFKNEAINFNKIIRGEDVFGRLVYWGRISKKHLTYNETEGWFKEHPHFYAPSEIKYYGNAFDIIKKYKNRLRITKSIIKNFIKLKIFFKF